MTEQSGAFGYTKCTSACVGATNQFASQLYQPHPHLIQPDHSHAKVSATTNKVLQSDAILSVDSAQTSPWTAEEAQPAHNEPTKHEQIRQPVRFLPSKHWALDPVSPNTTKFCDLTHLHKEYEQRLSTAQTLRTELARLKQANTELATEIEHLRCEKESLLVQVEAQENKNNQLTAENTECMIRVAENQFLEENIVQIKKQLNEVNEQAEASRKARQQLRADCVRVELERQHLLDEYFRIESSRTVNREQLEALHRRREQLERYQEDMVQRQQLAHRWQEVAGAIRVFVRIRSVQPTLNFATKHRPVGGGLFDSGCITVITEEKIGLHLNRDCPTSEAVKQYQFNKIFTPDSNQKSVYQIISEPVKRAVEGFNVTILFHGTSGAGKTYTCCGTPEDPGVASFACSELLKLIKEKGSENWKLNVSMIEIHNEHVVCLLSKRPVRIKDTGLVVHVENQKEVPVKDVKEFNSLLYIATSQRKSISIEHSHVSSRSHLFILIKVISQTSVTVMEYTHVGTLILGDLAGLARINPTENLTQDRHFKQESWYLQKSLILFASLFHNLRRADLGINCRGSRLTELLKPCFCGDSYLTLVLNVTDDPELSCTTQTILEVGKSAQGIVLGPPINHLSI
ncbi:Kinesin-1 [Fasciolopsis buskii]|uniref:Kinesin-1 n=1 Tax=Fasciolopsis buskii TaxID=27845 RepID=A0A8E0RTG3_9TREM|nr:Kinesin-1 [Fasciolopsis buski]